MADLFINTIKTDKPFDDAKVQNILDNYKKEITDVRNNHVDEISYLSEDCVSDIALDISDMMPDADVTFSSFSEFDRVRYESHYSNGWLQGETNVIEENNTIEL